MNAIGAYRWLVPDYQLFSSHISAWLSSREYRRNSSMHPSYGTEGTALVQLEPLRLLPRVTVIKLPSAEWMNPFTDPNSVPLMYRRRPFVTEYVLTICVHEWVGKTILVIFTNDVVVRMEFTNCPLAEKPISVTTDMRKSMWEKSKKRLMMLLPHQPEPCVFDERWTIVPLLTLVGLSQREKLNE